MTTALIAGDPFRLFFIWRRLQVRGQLRTPYIPTSWLGVKLLVLQRLLSFRRFGDGFSLQCARDESTPECMARNSVTRFSGPGNRAGNGLKIDEVNLRQVKNRE